MITLSQRTKISTKNYPAPFKYTKKEGESMARLFELLVIDNGYTKTDHFFSHPTLFRRMSWKLSRRMGSSSIVYSRQDP